MPFWKRNKETINGHSKEKINYKSRLEHKQYLAQESPEPFYDLIDCGLKSVPSGVYSWIKVSRKHALLLQENELSSLSGGGYLSELSENLLGLLKNLQKLNLHHNRLKRLPDSIGQLKKT
ncbi:LRSAM1 [Lepeophtheirus salmonis]|uniref:LRSAM1 n=1 Tax=Lepeophtheirus salmonis TaxID=72036 RepID=A0A7R8HE12_LEPSM|nr:LRSAM1 [Lepeophtheirus salmonis]CAF3034243.1 LRSAM1 [Lepeophtheirus salmonis]